MPPLLVSSILVPIWASASVPEGPNSSLLSLAKLGWAVHRWECERHLINVRVCLLPSADKAVLQTTSISSCRSKFIPANGGTSLCRAACKALRGKINDTLFAHDMSAPVYCNYHYKIQTVMLKHVLTCHQTMHAAFKKLPLSASITTKQLSIMHAICGSDDQRTRIGDEGEGVTKQASKQGQASKQASMHFRC